MRILHASHARRRAETPRPRSPQAALLIIALASSAAAFASDDAARPAEPEPQKPAADAPAGAPAPTQAGGLVMFDYQSLKIKGDQPIDLMGFHFLNRFNDWLYMGVGGHAPLFRGSYGGFMAFDVSVHAERRLFGNVSASVGASLGGGGGGKNTEQSKTLSGSGGFVKSYIGLGYRVNDDMSVGVNYSKIRFTNSVINGSQFGLFVQTPFSYSVAPYASAGRRVEPQAQADQAAAASGRTDSDVVSFGLDNIVQINPQGTRKQTVNLVDAQYDHFVTDKHYLLFGGSVGYHGIAGYNQVYGGVGYRHPLSARSSVKVQLALGSGGYAPDKIDTGSGLLIFPKVSAEYRLTDDLGLALSGGYLYAPRGSSKNVTVGASLVFHDAPGDRAAAPDRDARDYRGYRFHSFLQTQYNVKVGEQRQDKLKLLTVQLDSVSRDNRYIPIQGSIAYDSYLGYPGYGELLAGLGAQSRYGADDSVQTFAQLLVGTNIHGIIMKPAVGVNVGLSDRFAFYGQLGATVSLDSIGLYPKQYKYRSTSLGLGLSYRFSLP